MCQKGKEVERDTTEVDKVILPAILLFLTLSLFTFPASNFLFVSYFFCPPFFLPLSSSLSLSHFLQLSYSLPSFFSPLSQLIPLTFLIINASRCSSRLSATLTLIFEQLTRSSLAERDGNGNGASFAAAESELQLRKPGIGPGSGP